ISLRAKRLHPIHATFVGRTDARRKSPSSGPEPDLGDLLPLGGPAASPRGDPLRPASGCSDIPGSQSDRAERERFRAKDKWTRLVGGGVAASALARRSEGWEPDRQPRSRVSASACFRRFLRGGPASSPRSGVMPPPHLTVITTSTRSPGGAWKPDSISR